MAMSLGERRGPSRATAELDRGFIVFHHRVTIEKTCPARIDHGGLPLVTTCGSSTIARLRRGRLGVEHRFS